MVPASSKIDGGYRGEEKRFKTLNSNVHPLSLLSAKSEKHQ